LLPMQGAPQKSPLRLISRSTEGGFSMEQIILRYWSGMNSGSRRGGLHMALLVTREDAGASSGKSRGSKESSTVSSVVSLSTGSQLPPARPI